MQGLALASVFTNAAMPQKVVLVALTAAIPALAAAAILAALGRRPGRPWQEFVDALRLIGPGLGLLVGAMDSFHMGETIKRVPFDPTAKQLAPGILEVSTFVGLGALVGLIAVAAGTVMTRTRTGR